MGSEMCIRDSVKARCNYCHAFPAFTNLSQYPSRYIFPQDGASLEAVDTPSLLAVSMSAPYLHDARAPMLEQVLKTKQTSDRHGDVHVLSSEEFAALLTFLRSL